jgi:D-mannonate dehydratase
VRNIIAGLPGAEEGYTLEQFQAQLTQYDGVEIMRGRPRIGRGGSSGCTASLMPTSSATGTMARGYTLEQFQAQLTQYDGIDKARLREHMATFLRAIGLPSVSATAYLPESR